MSVIVQAEDSVLVIKVLQGGHVLGYVVIDSTINGQSYGGLRMLADVDEAQLRAAAQTMTLKYSFVGRALGGAKAGVRGDPEAPEALRMERLGLFGQAIAPLLQQGIYVPYEDIGTDHRAIRHVLKGAGVRVRPRVLCGSSSGYYTGVSVKACAAQAMGHLGMKLSGSRVAIEGFGKVGAPLAGLMAKTGTRVVAISTSRGALYSPQGLDTRRLIALGQRVGSRVVDEYEEAERIDRAALLELPVDLLCPCALGHSLHAGNAAQVVAPIICPGANNPITAEAESVLFERGVLVVPDFVANCGGALGAPMHFALVDPERIIGFIDRHIGGRLAGILAEADQLGLMPKQVAEAMALRRLGRLQQTARHPTFTRRLFRAGLALYGRGLLPGRVIKPLALRFFEKALADDAER